MITPATGVHAWHWQYHTHPQNWPAFRVHLHTVMSAFPTVATLSC